MPVWVWDPLWQRRANVVEVGSEVSILRHAAVYPRAAVLYGRKAALRPCLATDLLAIRLAGIPLQEHHTDFAPLIHIGQERYKYQT